MTHTSSPCEKAHNQQLCDKQHTDTHKLKRLAEDTEGAIYFGDIRGHAMNKFKRACTPETILTLIAERDEAVALLRECVGADCESTLRDYDISALLSRIDSQKEPAG